MRHDRAASRVRRIRWHPPHSGQSLSGNGEQTGVDAVAADPANGGRCIPHTWLVTLRSVRPPERRGVKRQPSLGRFIAMETT